MYTKCAKLVGNEYSTGVILTSAELYEWGRCRARRSTLVSRQEDVLRGYAAHGDSLSLAILIHVTRTQYSHFGNWFWPDLEFSDVLEGASKFNVRDTLPELQHEFCALWNQIAQENNISMAFCILRQIRNIYFALHQGTDSAPARFSTSTGDLDAILEDPSSYPVCNIPGHHPDSTHHIHDDTASATLAHFVQHDTAAPLPYPLAAPVSRISHVPSSFSPTPLPVSRNLVDVPLLANNMSASVPPRRAHQTANENLHSPVTPPDPVASGLTREVTRQ